MEYIIKRDIFKDRPNETFRARRFFFETTIEIEEIMQNYILLFQIVTCWLRLFLLSGIKDGELLGCLYKFYEALLQNDKCTQGKGLGVFLNRIIPNNTQ